ncbi:EthD domain-containing protein [Shumkonia mesophila]|uniref:hypothetical protein n=1 Tax=Shumkonia mesophila TaxID=2838854 RepID=UPI0029341395|nr:hypothetical protein [Shumkonia mesophila]
MYIRCAYFVGTVAPENRARFDSFIDTECAPIIATFPNLRSFRILRGRWYEKGAPDIYMTIEMSFDGDAAVEAYLTSEERARNGAKMKQILPLFEGRIFHINHEVGAHG